MFLALDRKSTRLNSNHHTISYTHFFFNDTATTEIYTLSLHDALPICNKYTVVRFRFLLFHKSIIWFVSLCFWLFRSSNLSMRFLCMMFARMMRAKARGD